MTKYISVDRVISIIRDHAQRVGNSNEIYQLAHLHILELIRSEAKNLAELSINGYPVSDLAVIADRLRKEGKEPELLEASNEVFLAGYKAAKDEIMRNLEESINKAIDRS